MEGFHVVKVAFVLLLLQGAAESQDSSNKCNVIYIDSRDEVADPGCRSMGEKFTCNSLEAAVQGNDSNSPTLVLQHPGDFDVHANTSCICDKDKNDSCPPWFKRNDNTSSCECGARPHEMIRCHDDRGYASVLNCYCVTLDNTSKDGVSSEEMKLVAGACIYNCFNEKSYSPDYTPFHKLPPSPAGLNKEMCERYNRRGRLCGECKKNYVQPVYSYDITCVECKNKRFNVVLYMLAAFGPLTIFLFIMLACKVNATAPPLNAYIQFLQLIISSSSMRILLAGIKTGTSFKKDVIGVQILSTVYGIWNLDFFRTVYPPICLKVSSLAALSLDYAVAVYPLFLTAVIYALIELHARNVRLVVWLWRPIHECLFLCRRQWDIRSSIVDTFATFMLLSYVKFTSVSFDLLFPNQVYDINGTVAGVYLYYDSTVEYFGKEHLPYAILAIIVTVLFLVLPILFLLLYPWAFVRNCLKRCRLKFKVFDDISMAFYCHYKDGTEGTRNYQWFAAVHFITRALLLVTYAATRTAFYWGIAAIEVILISFAFLIAQPYKSLTHNTLEASQFLIVAMFCVSVLGLSATTAAAPRNIKFAMVIVFLTGAIPLLFGLGILLHWLTGKKNLIEVTKQTASQMKNCFTRNCLKCMHAKILSSGPEESLPDRLTNPEEYTTSLTQRLMEDD